MIKDKRGFELNEIGKIVLAVFLLAIMALAIYLLLSGKGSQVLDAIKNMLRFGR